MSFRPRKIRPGERLEGYPIDSHNQLVERDYELRRALATIDDPRRPKIKSPVHADIIWCEATDLEPGRVVRIRGVVSHPLANDDAPFGGLVFLCTAFSAVDQPHFALAQGPAKAGQVFDATLSTRTDDDTGELTLPDDEHGIEEGNLLTLIWEGGSRVGVVAGEVADDVVPFDGGQGDPLPDEETPPEIRVVKSADATAGVLPEAYWARVSVGDATHTKAQLPVTGTLLASSVDGNIPIIWKETGTGTKWAVVKIVASGSGDGDHRPEYVAFVSTPIPAGGNIGAGEGGSEVREYTEPSGSYSVFDGAAEIWNPFPYVANPGYYPVDFWGLVDLGGGEVVSVFTLTGFDLRGHDDWDEEAAQVLVHQPGNMPVWADVEDFGGDPTITFPPFDDDALWAAINALPDTAGYCIVISGTTIHVDMITSAAGVQATDVNLSAFQMWMHYAGASTRTDARWLTYAGFDNTDKKQLQGHEDGTFKFQTQSEWLKTADDYDATKDQLLVHFDAGGSPPIWKTATGYDVTKKQLLVNNTGSWEWLEIDAALNLLGGYNAAVDQSIGHDDSGATEWQDDGECSEE